MRLQAIEEALRIVGIHAEQADFVGARSERVIQVAEQTLGVTFPSSYRTFLSRLGAGAFGAQEVYGIVSDDFEDSGVPDAVWMTLEARRDWGLPESMVVVYFDGGTDYFVIDTGERGEPRVLCVTPGLSDFATELPVIADDFGAFFLDLVNEELQTDGD